MLGQQEAWFLPPLGLISSPCPPVLPLGKFCGRTDQLPSARDILVPGRAPRTADCLPTRGHLCPARWVSWPLGERLVPLDMSGFDACFPTQVYSTVAFPLPFMLRARPAMWGGCWEKAPCCLEAAASPGSPGMPGAAEQSSPSAPQGEGVAREIPDWV